MKIIFMGTPDFAVPGLQQLVAEGHEVLAAYTQPPRPAGRGKKLQPSAVQQAAEALNIKVFSPTSLKQQSVQQEMRALGADVAVVAAYGLLLPKAVLEMFPYGCINLHPSLLPRWRGAAPIQYPILHGDKETGMCLMQMDEGLDTGAILAQTVVPLQGTETAGQLHDHLAQLGAQMLLKLLVAVEQGTAPHTPQATEGITYAGKITKEMAAINWHQTAEEIERHIRAFSPFPVAWTEYYTPTETPPKAERLRIHKASISALGKTGFAPGTIISTTPLTIQCGKGALQLNRLQRGGGRILQAAEFLRGCPLSQGGTLGTVTITGASLPRD